MNKIGQKQNLVRFQLFECKTQHTFNNDDDHGPGKVDIFNLYT